MRTIGDNIRLLREERRMSKSELSQLLDLKSYTTITKWENGENHPRGKEIRMLCDLFNVSADYLLGLEDQLDDVVISYYKYYPVSISAGVLTDVDAVTSETSRKIPVPDYIMNKYAGSSDVFFVNVSGTSMNRKIPSGSIIGIKPLSSVHQLKEGDVVVFRMDNEFSIKCYVNDPDSHRIIFRPDSTDAYHTDIVVPYDRLDELEIYGKLVATIAPWG